MSRQMRSFLSSYYFAKHRPQSHIFKTVKVTLLNSQHCTGLIALLAAEIDDQCNLYIDDAKQNMQYNAH